MVVGPGEADRFLSRSIEEIHRLCDDALVVCNNTDPATEVMLTGAGIEWYRDDREWGKFQPQIKSDLLKRIGNEKDPGWILSLDADEVFDSTFTREQLDKLIARGGIGWYFYFLNMWNDEQHYAHGMSFWNIRLFRYAPEFGLDFLRKPVHCGLAPPAAYKAGNYAPFFVKHFGLMRSEDRQKKIERYNKYDPDAVYKSDQYYEALASKRSGRTLDEGRIREELQETNSYKMKPTFVQPSDDEGKFVYIRKDGRTIDVPKKDARRYERQGWVVISEVNTARVIDKPTYEEEAEFADHQTQETQEEEKNVCVICGKEYKTANGLSKHKETHA